MWAGVNHCRPCLALVRASADRRTPLLAWLFWAVFASLLFGLAGRAMVWAGVLWAKLL